MNAYELAELRQRLEPKGLTVDIRPAEAINFDISIALVFETGTMVYKLNGPSGWAMLRQFRDGWYYTARNLRSNAKISAMGVATMDECLQSILAVIL